MPESGAFLRVFASAQTAAQAGTPLRMSGVALEILGNFWRLQTSHGRCSVIVRRLKLSGEMDSKRDGRPETSGLQTG
jgi:hypothetical protein